MDKNWGCLHFRKPPHAKPGRPFATTVFRNQQSIWDENHGKMSKHQREHIPWFSMILHDVPWLSMMFHDFPWCSMIFPNLPSANLWDVPNPNPLCLNPKRPRRTDKGAPRCRPSNTRLCTKGPKGHWYSSDKPPAKRTWWRIANCMAYTYTNYILKPGWWYTYPSEKIWVRQLGWLFHSQYMESHKIHSWSSHHQPETIETYYPLVI